MPAATVPPHFMEAIDMQSSEAVLAQARSALASLTHHGQPVQPSIQLRFADGALVLEGEVPDIEAKTRAAARIRKVDGIDNVVDHVRIANGSTTGGDGELRNAVCERLLQSVDFRSFRICSHAKGRSETMREAMGECWGEIGVHTEDGVVTLRGQVISLSHMRLAGVLAWWTPGCRCVINELKIEPAERDNDEEITEALRLVLETDALIDADQIVIRTENRVVTLEGYATEGSRRQAERDAWYLLGVEDVVNRIAVQQPS